MPINRWVFLFGRKEEHMKKFNERLVRLVAIDKPNKRQIYVHDDKHRDLIISTLLDMGFKTYQEDLSNCYVHLPIVIDTDDY